MIKLSTLKPLEKNPFKSKGDEQIKAIGKSIQNFEKMMSVRQIVYDEEMNILGGNKRYFALKMLGYKEINEDWTKQVLGWTEEEKKEFIVKDNTHFGSEWDYEIFDEWGLSAEQLTEWGLDLPVDWGGKLEAEEDDFDVPAGGIETDIVIGDLFEIGQYRLLCGDSTDSDSVAKLMNGENADMVFTSPPYNANSQIGFTKKGGIGLKTSDFYLDKKTDNKTELEYLQFNADIFSTIKIFCTDEAVILYNIGYNHNSPSDYINVIKKSLEYFNLVETVIWKKSMVISLQGDNLTRNYEFIFVLYNAEGKPKLNKTHFHECIGNLWEVSNVGANSEHHKACFPVKLVEQAINIYAKENALLYEPFLGSGTTMVAAHQLKRKCYGMELDPKYCQVIIDRMKKLDPTLIIKKNGI